MSRNKNVLCSDTKIPTQGGSGIAVFARIVNIAISLMMLESFIKIFKCLLKIITILRFIVSQMQINVPYISMLISASSIAEDGFKQIDKRQQEFLAIYNGALLISKCFRFFVFANPFEERCHCKKRSSALFSRYIHSHQFFINAKSFLPIDILRVIIDVIINIIRIFFIE